MKRILLAVLVLAGAMACTDQMPVEPDLSVVPEAGTAQAPSEMGLAVKMVPFTMKGTWWPATEGDESPCAGYEGPRMSFPEWEGTATHMGSVTGHATNCTLDDGSYFLLSQTSAMYAANGDILYAYGTEADDGTQLIIHPDLSFEIYPVPFAGGTGRFENATGYYHLYGANLFGGDFHAVGWISSVGSSK